MYVCLNAGVKQHRLALVCKLPHMLAGGAPLLTSIGRVQVNTYVFGLLGLFVRRGISVLAAKHRSCRSEWPQHDRDLRVRRLLLRLFWSCRVLLAEQD